MFIKYFLWNIYITSEDYILSVFTSNNLDNVISKKLIKKRRMWVFDSNLNVLGVKKDRYFNSSSEIIETYFILLYFLDLNKLSTGNYSNKFINDKLYSKSSGVVKQTQIYLFLIQTHIDNFGHALWKLST